MKKLLLFMLLALLGLTGMVKAAYAEENREQVKKNTIWILPLTYERGLSDNVSATVGGFLLGSGDFGLGVGVKYYFKPGYKGWYAGVAAAQYSIDDFDLLGIGLGVGHRWQWESFTLTIGTAFVSVSVTSEAEGAGVSASAVGIGLGLGFAF